MMRLWIAALACATAVPVHAQDLEADALKLADAAPPIVEKAGDWRSFAEVGLGRSPGQAGGAAGATRRLSLDVQYEHTLDRSWSLSFADRLDTSWPSGGGRRGINTPKEAYASWRVREDAMLDVGRINVRNGVAIGYNPTDWLGRGAVRSVVSIDPASLKQNRAGSEMVRAQTLWAGGSATMLYARDPGRLLLSATHHIGPVAPQFLLYREDSQDTQFGLNVTSLVNDATVAHLEWAGGRSRSLLVQAAPAWRHRLSTGLTWTTARKLSLTGEFHYNGAGAGKDEWERLRLGPPAQYWAYRAQVQAAQDLPTRQELFFHVLWQDVLVPQLDLSAMHAGDLDDKSRRLWLELRYHAGRTDFALQWQRQQGGYLSNFGALPGARAWQWTIRRYF